MDISINIEDYRFNYRTCGIVIHNNKILFHKCPSDCYYALMGGRVKIGESSSTALKREVLEEIGKEIEITDFIGVVENFFTSKGSKYHELEFIHKFEFSDERDKLIENTLYDIEEDSDTTFEWINIKDIPNLDIRPAVVKNVLCSGSLGLNLVNIDGSLQ